jgi:hypothetical protein
MQHHAYLHTTYICHQMHALLAMEANVHHPLKFSFCWTHGQSGPGHLLNVKVDETDRIKLLLFGLQNRTFESYLAAIHRIFIQVMSMGGSTDMFRQC